MENRKLNKVKRFEAESSSFNLKNILKTIEEADVKIKERQESDNKIIKPIREIKKKSIGNYSGGNPISNIKIANTRTVNNIKNTSGINSTKKVNRVKRK